MNHRSTSTHSAPTRLYSKYDATATGEGPSGHPYPRGGIEAAESPALAPAHRKQGAKPALCVEDLPTQLDELYDMFDQNETTDAARKADISQIKRNIADARRAIGSEHMREEPQDYSAKVSAWMEAPNRRDLLRKIVACFSTMSRRGDKRTLFMMAVLLDMYKHGESDFVDNFYELSKDKACLPSMLILLDLYRNDSTEFLAKIYELSKQLIMD